MAITLGAVTLPEDLIWEDELSWSGVDSRVTLSRGGLPLVFEQAVGKGRPITLAGGIDYGWIQRGPLLEVYALAGIPYATYTLTMGSVSRRVRIVNEDPPAVSAVPLREMPEYEYHLTDWFHSLVIKLTEI